jgi:hypothetical protein
MYRFSRTPPPELASAIEDIVIAARIRERLACDDGIRHDLEVVAAELGISVEDPLDDAPRGTPS